MPRAKAEPSAERGVTAKSTRGKRVTKEAGQEQSPAVKRSYLKQTDVPITSLDDALRLPQAIFDHYAGKPTAPFNVAKALNVDPKGSQLKVLSGAAIAFGLIEGGAQASVITPTELARRVIRPKVEDEDIDAKREAVLKPRIFGEFLRNYDGNQFPRQDIALNVLEHTWVFPVIKPKKYWSASVRVRARSDLSKNLKVNTTSGWTLTLPAQNPYQLPVGRVLR